MWGTRQLLEGENLKPYPPQTLFQGEESEEIKLIDVG
jgi:hypothetical protein